MKFERWNSRKVLVAIGALPFVIGLLALVTTLLDLRHARMVSVVAIAVIFVFGFFMVSLHPTLEVDGRRVTRRWHLFFVLKFKRWDELSHYERIEVDAAIATHGHGSIDSSTGGTGQTRYYRITLVHRADAAKNVFVSEHVLLERPRDVTRCVDLSRELAAVSGLKLVLGERVRHDATAAGMTKV